MFDIRMKEDVLRDLHLLNDAVLELEEKEKMLSACILKFPIKEIKVCKHNADVEGRHEKIKCKKCNGTGYEIILKEN